MTDFVYGPHTTILALDDDNWGSRRVRRVGKFFFFFVNYTTDIFRIDLHLRMEMIGQEWVEGGDDENGRWWVFFLYFIFVFLILIILFIAYATTNDLDASQADRLPRHHHVTPTTTTNTTVVPNDDERGG